MRRVLLSGSVMFVLLLAATSRSDVSPLPSNTPPPSADPEPITGTAIPAEARAAVQQHRPFTSHDPGPGAWSYDQLSPEDKATADRGRDVGSWKFQHDAFTQASRERAHQASAASAAAQLGMDELDTLGVVP